MEPITIKPGRADLLGINKTESGVNFALYGPNFLCVSLVIQYDSLEKRFPCFQTGSIWHLQLETTILSFSYGYEVEYKNNEKKIVVDPRCRQLNTSRDWLNSHLKRNSTLPCTYQIDDPFDWEKITPPQTSPEEWIIYECHVRGFTKDESSKTKDLGTFEGLIEKLDYLSDLGINVLELMPIHEFFENEHPNSNQGLCNYWGYSPASYFSIMPRYCSSSSPYSPIYSLKKLVKACHQRQIKVIVDVVFNHTATYSKCSYSHPFESIDPSSYYILDSKNNNTNFTGCGNTVNTNHPITTALLLDSLKLLHQECHVDGFRFDLASIFYRSSEKEVSSTSYFLETLQHDPLLQDAILIAEPWDSAGQYHVGNYDKKYHKWLEWNGKFRDDVRSFVHGHLDQAGIFASRISGSEDLYYGYSSPCHSINYICSHDGFCLRDLVSYNHKHNQENLEHNQDGSNDNRSYNYGVEGKTNDEKIEKLRLKQMKNLIAILFTSQGTPMITMGDELMQSREGNNNPWCHDSQINWLNWRLFTKENHHLQFTKHMIGLRKRLPHFRRKTFLSHSDIEWISLIQEAPLWNVPLRSIGCIHKLNGHADILCLYYFENEENNFLLPKSAKKWKLICDTSSEIKKKGEENIFEGGESIKLSPFTVMLLEATEPCG